MAVGRRVFRGSAVIVVVVGCASPVALWAAGEALPSIRARATVEVETRAPGVPEDAELEAAGARIGKVSVDRQNIFDTTLPEEDTALFRFANWLHIQTRERVIQKQLLFKPGDRYEARLLQESERILRATRYLHDARIRPIAYADGSVDIEVTTQDVWTLNPGVSFGRKGGKNTSSFGLDDTNLLGLGSSLSAGYKSSVDRSSKLLLYHDSQLGDSWWALDAQYANNSDGRAQGLAIDHPFYALDTRWAAGMSVKNDTRIDSTYDGGQVVNQFNVHDRGATAYGGWSAGLQGGWATRWTAGMTLDEHHANPIFSANGPQAAPDNRKLVYPWLGVELVEDEFQETHNQDQIGKTEDVPLGWRARLQLGVATTSLGSDRDAGIFNTSVSTGLRPTPAQTLLLAGSATGRLEKGRLAGSMFSTSGRYYLREAAGRVFYTGLSVDRGVGLDSDQQLLLGGDNGLRGYPLRYQGGNGRWLLTVEQRAFTTWYPFRLFNVGGAVFYDMGRTWDQSSTNATASHGLLRDLGFGLRLGNSRTALGNVVHVDLAFPLDGDPSISKVQLLVEAKRSF